MSTKEKDSIISSSDISSMISRITDECFAFAKAGDVNNVSRVLDLLGLNIACDAEGNTLLHIAASVANQELADLLIDKGFTLNIKNNYGLTPKNIAELNHNKMQAYFLRKESTELLFNAVITNNMDDFYQSLACGAETQRIFKHRPFLGANLLHYMAFYNRAQMIDYLCENFVVNVDCQDQTMKETPLHTASQNNHSAAIEALLKNQANINSIDGMGWTPLHRGAINGSVQAVATLLENNADVETKDIMGDTPMHSALKNRNYNILPLLIKAKADLAAVNNFGERVDEIAKQLGVNLNNL